MVFEKGKWILADVAVSEDQYTEYKDSFDYFGGECILRISCDTDYTLFVNGKFAASNQYSDFEHYKIYDTVDITPFLNINEKNLIKITVFYCGRNTQRYRIASAGLIYEVLANDKLLCKSCKETLSRLSPTYLSGRCIMVSRQLGFTFGYDSTKESELGYKKSVEVNKECNLFPRPIKKLTLGKRHPMRSVKRIDENTLQIDLGEEVVGIASMELYSQEEQDIHVSYGEYLEGGRVRGVIDYRHFFYDYRAKAGKNDFTEYMLRLSARYLEIRFEKEIELEYLGIIPQFYEVSERRCLLDCDLDQKIYDICLNTLRLCMMEHYVDTPWREQCLYAFDSRNQMLCGYYVFEDGNRDYARASLALLGEDRRDDNLLSICAPSGTVGAIISFALYFIISIKEYTEYTSDTSLIKHYLKKCESILDVFTKRFNGQLIPAFAGEGLWNFYDWSEHLSGEPKDGDTTPDLVLNSLFIMALNSLRSATAAAGLPFKYEGIAEKIKAGIIKNLKSDGPLLSFKPGDKKYTALGNSLAILAGVLSKEEAERACEAIVKGEATPSSLSMNIWKYEALMQVDKEKYKDYILEEIRKSYKVMLDFGSTTVWETLEGASAFGNAGSLCHGWSAVPIYIYHKYGLAKYDKGDLKNGKKDF